VLPSSCPSPAPVSWGPPVRLKKSVASPSGTLTRLDHLQDALELWVVLLWRLWRARRRRRNVGPTGPRPAWIVGFINAQRPHLGRQQQLDRRRLTRPEVVAHRAEAGLGFDAHVHAPGQLHAHRAHRSAYAVLAGL